MEQNQDVQESREKYWSELTLDEKAERMREHIKMFDRRLGELWEIKHLLENHTHDAAGKAVKPLHDRFGGVMAESAREQDPDKVYF